jgi:putative MATE family efflux protein
MASEVTSSDPPALVLSGAPTWRKVLVLGWPALLQQLLIFVVMLYDAWLAGQYRPEQGDHKAAQAAQTTAMYLSWFLSSYAVLISVGATALVARFIGAGDGEGAIQATNQSLLLGVVLGAIGSTLGWVYCEELLYALHLEGDAHTFATGYLRPIFAALVFQMVSGAGIACLIGAGDTKTGLWVLGGVALLNVPLAYIFRHGWGPIPSYDFAGIAIGTALSNVLGGIAVLIVLVRGRAGLRLVPSLMLPDWSILRRLLRISVPAGLDSLLVAGGQLLFLRVVNSLSIAEKGAHGIALRWEALAFLTGSAFGTASMALVGQNLGAGRPEEAARTAWSAFKLCCLVMGFCGLVFVVCAPWMFALFCPNEDQREIITAGVPVLRLIAVAMPPLASTIVFTASLRGAGDTRVPVLFTVVGFFCIRLPLAKYLTQPEVGLGLMGAWLAMIVDVFARGLFVMLRFVGGKWRRIEV